MKDTKCVFRPVLFFLFFAIFGLGCGSDLKLSLRSDEKDKDHPSVALVRRVELTYHNGSGREELRQNIPVLGLSQPVATESEAIRNLDWDKEGIFEARAYTADGLLLLRGTTRANPDEEQEVRITMSRSESQASAMGSAYLKKLRVRRVPELADYELNAGQLRAEMDRQGCVTLPALVLRTSGFEFPQLTFETTVKSPQLTFEVGQSDAQGAFQGWAGKMAIPLGVTGDPEIELGNQFFNGVLFQGSNKQFQIRFYSDQYEGCVNVTTRLQTLPLIVTASAREGAGAVAQRFLRVPPIAHILIRNPNPFTVHANLVVQAGAEGVLSGTPVELFYHTSCDRITLDELRRGSHIQQNLEVHPGDTAGFCVFAAAIRTGYATDRMKIHWSVTSQLQGSDGPSLEPVSGTLEL
ncbi:MAG: hypothetical protein AB1540_03805 [Bdellovibrionota bacterium]